MKWLFYLVVLANAAFLSWNSFVQDKAVIPKQSVYTPPVSESIRLLSEPPSQNEVVEKSQTEKMEAALNQAITGTVVNSNVSSGFCPQIEVEKSVEDAQITKVLKELGWKYSDKNTVGKRPKFWLYIDAPETKKRASEIVKDLTAKSIDSFIITREEMKNRISLGLYSSKDRAQQARERIEKASGYSVNVYAHMRTVPLYQIDIKQSINEDDWDAFLAQFDLTKMMIKLEKKPC
ncbi:SPOR domain-containing protein [Marinomonas sp. TI.3.20]|uniref:SPOR domain-containing protein n=1 Tax=Marinomonas sp. TI.3.20 TaxID=3121296 RepID=UPI0031201485